MSCKMLLYYQKYTMRLGVRCPTRPCRQGQTTGGSNFLSREPTQPEPILDHQGLTQISGLFVINKENVALLPGQKCTLRLWVIWPTRPALLSGSD